MLLQAEQELHRTQRETSETDKNQLRAALGALEQQVASREAVPCSVIDLVKTNAAGVGAGD